ncbi:hypothetical protein E2C01_092981 [Portunus trituberculatus]|uniref:Uncharacterized protein n=1 Tax=Portunus trituberculatus TaxID=210409 RepID=A0A5B7JWZ0_PORTR|nr:hypothetical protein [Portunus trituberculatus]
MLYSIESMTVTQNSIRSFTALTESQSSCTVIRDHLKRVDRGFDTGTTTPLTLPQLGSVSINSQPVSPPPPSVPPSVVFYFPYIFIDIRGRDLSASPGHLTHIHPLSWSFFDQLLFRLDTSSPQARQGKAWVLRIIGISLSVSLYVCLSSKVNKALNGVDKGCEEVHWEWRRQREERESQRQPCPQYK